MQLARTADELEEKFESVQRLAKSNFKASGLFLKRFIASARHVEVQIFGDGRGLWRCWANATARRSAEIRKFSRRLRRPASRSWFVSGSTKRREDWARRQNISSAGTCEFMYDAESEGFYFLEVNTRLQVEHCVTEEVSGLDLVEWMIRLAVRRSASARRISS